METIGPLRGIALADPLKWASPKAKMPPSDATSQYPRPSGVDAMATIGRLRGIDPAEP